MNEAVIFVGVLWLIHEVAFFGTWGFWGLAFKQGWWASSAFDGGKEPPAELYRRGVIDVMVSHGLFPISMLGVWWLWKQMGGTMDGMPEWWELPVYMVVFIVVQDTLFYWSHRTLHHKRLFRLIHRKHHEWRHVRGVSAEHSHLAETVLNFIAMWAAPVLLGCHFWVVAAWVLIRIIESVHAHSGYGIDGISSRHAFHHRFPTKGCLGSFWGPWDPLMGTDKAWKEYTSKQRETAAGRGVQGRLK